MSSASASSSSVTSKALAARFPNAHRILSELHTMKKMNEELFMQLEDSRQALNTLAEQVPHSAEALAGIAHILDPSAAATTTISSVGHPSSSSSSQSTVAAAAATSAQVTSPTSKSQHGGIAMGHHVGTRINAVPVAPPPPPPPPAQPSGDIIARDDEDSGPGFMKRKFFQFVDEAFEKAKPSGGSATTTTSSGPSFEQMYVALRLRVTAHENAQKQLSMSNQRLEDCREELGKVRKAFRESSDEFDRCKEERNALRSAIAVLSSSTTPTSSSPAAVPQDGNSALSTSSALPSAKLEGVARTKEARVDDLFNDLFDDGKTKKATPPAVVPAGAAQPSTTNVHDEERQLLLSDNKKLSVNIQLLSKQLLALEEGHAALTAQSAPLEKLLTAAQLEIEGLNDTVQTLTKDILSLRNTVAEQEASKRGFMLDMQRLQDAHAASVEDLRRTSAKLLETTTALSSMQSLPKKLTSLQRELTDAHNRLSEATAARLAQEQLREQREREVFALQRMLNSRELDSETGVNSIGIAAVGNTSAVVHGGIVNAVAVPTAGLGGRTVSNATRVASSASSATTTTTTVGDERDESELEEALHRARLSLRSALHAKKRAEGQLSVVAQERDCLRSGFASLGKRVMVLDAKLLSMVLASSSIDRNHHVGQTTENSASSPSATPTKKALPLGSQNRCSSSSSITPTTAPSLVVGAACQTEEDELRQCDAHRLMPSAVASSSLGGNLANAESSSLVSPTHQDLHATISALEESVTALQKEKRVLQRTVLELQETIVLSTAASPLLLDASRQEKRGRGGGEFTDDSDDQCSDDDDDVDNGTKTAATNWLAEADPDVAAAEAATVPPQPAVVIRGGTWQAYPAPVTTNSMSTATTARGGTKQSKGLRGFFGRMVGGAASAQRNGTGTGGGGAAPASKQQPLEYVPKQQLHTIQKLLEAQLKENLVLQAQLDHHHHAAAARPKATVAPPTK